jgi:hypothetical protein
MTSTSVRPHDQREAACFTRWSSLRNILPLRVYRSRGGQVKASPRAPDTRCEPCPSPRLARAPRRDAEHGAEIFTAPESIPGRRRNYLMFVSKPLRTTSFEGAICSRRSGRSSHRSVIAKPAVLTKRGRCTVTTSTIPQEPRRFMTCCRSSQTLRFSSGYRRRYAGW